MLPQLLVSGWFFADRFAVNVVGVCSIVYPQPFVCIGKPLSSLTRPSLRLDWHGNRYFV
ncbi:hypothetical protein RRSWK_01907 [Rhodopirellula sp. SWK7]|nr:hypothetical protein RRSWK_01907 [Rhodopirellula sp. SWK7]